MEITTPVSPVEFEAQHHPQRDTSGGLRVINMTLTLVLPKVSVSVEEAHMEGTTCTQFQTLQNIQLDEGDSKRLLTLASLLLFSSSLPCISVQSH